MPPEYIRGALWRPVIATILLATCTHVGVPQEPVDCSTIDGGPGLTAQVYYVFTSAVVIQKETALAQMEAATDVPTVVCTVQGYVDDLSRLGQRTDAQEAAFVDARAWLRGQLLSATNAGLGLSK